MRTASRSRMLLVAVTIVVLTAFLRPTAFAQFSRFGDRHVAMKVEGSALKILPVQHNVYMVVGAGPNITIHKSDRSVVVVNTGMASMSDDLRRAIRQISDRPVGAVINTNAREENTAGNEAIAASGEAVDFRFLGQLTAFLGAGAAAPIIGHDNVAMRMSGARPGEVARSAGSVPTEAFARSTKLWNGEGIQVVHAPAATTDADSYVFFRGSEVISVGDLMSTVRYPTIDLKRGGSIHGLIRALTEIVELCIFQTQSTGGTYIVPGEGRIADNEDVTGYRDMLTIIRDRVQAAIKQGKTLAQVRTARLARDYDPRYGSSDALIESIYQSLTQTSSS